MKKENMCLNNYKGNIRNFAADFENILEGISPFPTTFQLVKINKYKRC